MGLSGAMGAVGIGASIAGGITSASGAKQLGAAQQQMYQYQAGVAQINAQTAQQNADYARDQGSAQAAQVGLKAGQQMGQTIAAQASSGLDINSGSAVQVRAGQKIITGMDEAQVVSNAARTAYNFDVQSVQYQNQATLDILAGNNAVTAASINAESSILGTVSSVASKWSSGSSVGMFSGGGSGSSSNSGMPTFASYMGG
jgi:hypothetical protein